MPDFISALDDLISEGQAVRADWNATGLTDRDYEDRAARSTRWRANCAHMLTLLKLRDLSMSFAEIQDEGLREGYQTAQLIGIMQSARDAVAGGYLQRVEHLLHADFFTSITDQAQALLESGHHVPAAVLGRIIIETWLKDESERNGVQVQGTPKASRLNDELRKVGVFSTPKWRLVQGYLDLGNAAAHGKLDDVSSAEVTQMLGFVRTTCV